MFPFKTKAHQPAQQVKSYRTYAEAVNDYKCSSSYTDISIGQSILLYLATPPVRKAVDLISNVGSSLSPLVRDKKTGQVKETHDVLKLLENTSFGVSFKEFIWQASVNYLVTANNYFLLTKSAIGKPLQLFNVSPDQVTMSFSNGKVQSYTRTVTYEDNGGSNLKQVTVYTRKESVSGGYRVSFKDADGNELWHMREYNPLNPVIGKSKISTLDDSINGFNVAGRHNRRLIENGCTPTGFFLSKETIEDEEYKTLGKNIKKAYTGEENAGAPIILDGDLEYKEAHISPREMDWINGRKFDEKLIYDLYGIPQALVENKASSFNNLSTSMFMLYEYTVFPLLDKIYGELTDLLMSAFKDESLEIYYSKENIPSLDALKTESTLNKSKTSIYTIDELRTANGLEELPNGEGAVLLNAGKPQETEEPPEDAKSEFSRLMRKDGYNNKQIKARIEEFEKEGLL